MHVKGLWVRVVEYARQWAGNERNRQNTFG